MLDDKSVLAADVFDSVGKAVAIQSHLSFEELAHSQTKKDFPDIDEEILAELTEFAIDKWLEGWGG